MVTAIILAAGKGKRMGAAISKQFIDINRKPVIYYTLDKFLKCKVIDKIIIVVSEDEKEYFQKNIIEKYKFPIKDIVIGGKERQESVYNGLLAAKGSSIVLIHDGARPFVSNRIIEEGIKYAKEYGAAAPGVMPKDTIKVKDNLGFSKETLKRENLVAIQTPQTFKYELIMECHKSLSESNIQVTDDTMVAEIYGNKVYLYDGEYINIKLTTPEDLVLGEYLAKR